MTDLNIKDQLNEKFRQLDPPSKIYAAMLALAQCPSGYRRMIGLGQLGHGYEYVHTDECLEHAKEIDPAVVDSVLKIRELVEEAGKNLPEYSTADWQARGEALRMRPFLWTDAFEQPVYYEIRHAARDAIRALEARARSMMAAPAG